MAVTVHTAARLVRALAQIYAEKWNFLAIFAFVFGASLIVLARLDLLPTAPAAASVAVKANESAVAASAEIVIEAPSKIEISSIGLTATIANPDTTDIASLDNLLLKGAVRYPTSAKLGEAGNIVLFGHSSYLPVVGNQAFKTFNEIQKLHAGDSIAVYSDRTVYTYAVKTVSKESVNDNRPIPLAVSGKELTLVTCNSFATKSDRFVVVANFVESHVLPL